MGTSLGINKKFPIKSDEESSLVDKRFEISNHNLIKGVGTIVNLEEVIYQTKPPP
jgi:hypothetical protein